MFNKGDLVTFDSQTVDGVISGKIIRLNTKTATVIPDGSKIERGRAVQWRVAYRYLKAK